MFNPLGFLSHLTPLLWVGYGALALVLLGVAMTLMFGTFRACLACLRLTSWLMAKWWAWVWQTAARTFGTARWCTRKEMETAGLFNPGGIILGSVDGHDVRSHHPGHVLAILPTGAYKTTRIVEPNANEWPGSCVILDVKDEVYTRTHATRQTFGQVWRFSPTSSAGCHINPLDCLRWDSPFQTGDCQRLAMSLYEPNEWAGEDQRHWIITAESFMTGLLVDAHLRGDATLGGIYLWMSDPHRSEDDKLKAMEASPNGTVARAGHIMRKRADRERSGVWSTTEAALMLWEDEQVRKATSQSDFDWWNLQDQAQPISLYLHFKLSDEFRLRVLMRLIVEALLGRITDRDLSQPPTHQLLLLLDEVARLGQARQLENALSNLRGYGCQVVCILQDAPQAYRHYGEHTSLLAACGVWLAGANQDITTRELLVKQLGETTEVRDSPSASYSAWGLLQGQTHHQAHTPRPLLTSEEIRTLPSHELLIVHEGLPAIKASKWGLSSPRTTQAIRQPWRRLATSGGLAAALLMLSVWTTAHVLSPGTPQTTAPRLSRASEAPREAGDTLAPLPASGVNADQPTAQERAALNPFVQAQERQLIDGSSRMFSQAPRPWLLVETLSPKDPFLSPTSPRYESRERCETVLRAKIDGLHRMINVQSVGGTRAKTPDGYTEKLALGGIVQRHTYTCELDRSDSPS